MKVQKLTGGLGAEILGADLRNDDEAQAIRKAFTEHSVIVVREQTLTPDDHLHFARRFGPINVNRFFAHLPENPQIALVLKEADQTGAIGEEWHTDHSYDDVPAMGSILHAIQSPPHGGDTVFVSMAMAYEALSPQFQQMMRTLKAWHSSRHVFGDQQKETETARTGRVGNAEAAKQDALHPVVIKHPLSGRLGLYVNPQFTTRIDGLSTPESDAILQFLYAHCQKPEYQCRVSWRAGDVAMWDNRATWHKAINDYHGHRRLMHRVTVEGVALQAG